MMNYDEDDFLLISGLQHFAFCRRQWALIHIEDVWKENVLTMEGRILHENAHNGEIGSEKRLDRIISRGVPVLSVTLGVTGVCDVVEFIKDPCGIPLKGQEGLWSPVPVEYKHGRPKSWTDADLLQLCCQAMCLEEMLVCVIPKGCLYYGEPRRRLEADLTEKLREKVRTMLLEMHDYSKRRYTPRVKYSPACRKCSIADLCLPKMGLPSSVFAYIKKRVEEI